MERRIIDTIHFVEDSDDEIFLTKLLFSKEKIGAALAHHNSYAGLKAALAEKPADEPLLACIDLNMPGMKGTEIISSVLAEPANARVIIGICSGSEDPADKHSAKQAGARFFVHKPLNRVALEQICSTVEELSGETAKNGLFTVSCSL